MKAHKREGPKRRRAQAFLYSGLMLLLVAFLIRWMAPGLPAWVFWVLTVMAICLKAAFLVNVFRAKDFRPAPWLYFILAGVALIFVSMIFKYLYPIALLRHILFYGAILLKCTGLVLLLKEKGEQREQGGHGEQMGRGRNGQIG